MPDYPKTTGELVTVKDSKDGQAKLLDTLIQLLRQADAETLQSLNELAQTVSDLSGKAWKNNQSNLPATNNTYDIGSLSQMIRHIYSMGMTLGVEGEDWEINTNDGYLTLPSGLMLQFGREDAGTSSGKQDIPLSKPFPTKCISFQYLQALENSNIYTTQQAWTYTYNITSISSVRVAIQSGLIYLYWMAVGY